jgi:hypothetical protein
MSKPQQNRTSDPNINPSKLAAYLWSLPVNYITLTAITPAEGGAPPTTATFSKSVDGRAKCSKWIAAQQAAGRNIYFQDCSVVTVNTRPKKDDVTVIHAAHADIDTQGQLTVAEHAEALAAIIDTVKAYRPQPTDIICTGNGVQAYWYLDKPLPATPDNIALIEAANKALAAALGGDACHDVAHLMRVPYTKNIPNKLKRSKGRTVTYSYVIENNHDEPFMRYALADLPSEIDGSGSRPSNDNTDPLSYAGIGSPELPDKVDLSRLDAADRKTIKDGPPAGADRSTVIYAIACKMRRAKYDDGEILATITDPDNGISAHYDDNPQRDRIEQASRVIGRMNKEGVELPDFKDNVEPEETPEEKVEQSKLRRQRAREKAAKEAKKATRTKRTLIGNLMVTHGNDIEPELIDFIWQWVLARGVHTAVAGEGGGGKSQLAYNIAAAITKGGKLPDGKTAPKGRVVIFNAEDTTKTMFGPRLIAAGADMSMIVKVEAVANAEGERKFSLHTDLENLKVLCEQLGDVVLVIFDPASSYMGGDLDGRQNTQVRNVLDPLTKLAEDLDCAILSITHFNKGTAPKAIHRVMDSTAYVTAPRSVWGVFPDPDNGIGENLHRDRKQFVQMKTNIAPTDGTVRGWTYHMEMAPGGFDKKRNKPITATRIVWDGDATMTADQIIAAENDKGAPKTDYAKKWLADELADGAKLVSEVIAAAEADGISLHTLKDAKRLLRVVAILEGPGKPWQWRLPQEEERG